ncbi:multidrug ABC transporter permease [Paenibacillus macerans]|uniref:ABC transporter permease n=1 Tax=Paenibacillus macerans TaxID=44252 RepID=UPI001B2CF057|nr:ABC transporter permease [Paenibacillus macerans]GIP12751.1 multidrug ABC transporter permease [Paenibacillus macerans]
MKELTLEFFKLRRKKIGWMIAIFLAAEVLWIFMITSYTLARHPENVGWEYVLLMLSTLNGLFLPIISAVIVSRLCDMEHKGTTWKMLMATNVSRNRIYLAKWICANTLLLCGAAFQIGALSAFGVFKNFPDPLPLVLLVRLLAGTLLTNLAVTALQQWISLTFKNQTFALTLGMAGGFLGVTASFFPASIRKLFVWSYYTEMSPIGMSYNALAETSRYFVLPAQAGNGVAALLMIAIFYTAGCLHASRQEI